MTTMIRPRSRGRTRKDVIGALLLGAFAITGAAAPADGQAWTPRAPRDSAMSRHDLDRARDGLLSQLDSLKREFDEDALSPSERAQLSRQMTSLVTSLARMAMRDADVGKAIGLEMARANEEFARTQLPGMITMRLNGDVLPKGWIGINVDAPQFDEVRGNAFYVRYFEYPEIVSVEPNSPAERAGIAAGDVLMSYNGDDVRRRAINITRLFQPNNKVTVVVKRDGGPIVFPLRVAAAPAQFRERRLLPAAAMPPMPPQAPMPIEMESMLSRSMDASTAAVAGARLVDLRNADLARALGAASGVLVVDVAPPAATSGLRGGDVIVRAEGEPVTSVAQLRRVVERHAGNGDVSLVIMRGHREQKVTLRW